MIKFYNWIIARPNTVLKQFENVFSNVREIYFTFGLLHIPI